ncbi:hypothetical protein LIER_18451 [Lithospermum erythrorhizon]|uniref:SnoaL-like domain-containing protein n=1 Tax=Lithospermum erythrorhizon TaxID=34254 RepID=A0AAV3QFB0_LITER
MVASNFAELSLKPTINHYGILNSGSSRLHFSYLRRNHIGILGGVSSKCLKSFDSTSIGVHGSLNLRSGDSSVLRQASHAHFLKPCQVRGTGSEGTLNGETIIQREQGLKYDLQIAIEEEDYAKAAEIRDSLRLLQGDSKALVLATNTRFYNAFRNGDLAAMQTLWSKGDHVCIVHPGVSGICGYDLVMGSWEFVWAEYQFPLDIEIKDAQVHVKGDIAYVTCIEMVKTKGSSWGRQFATNVFERIEGKWFICVHHASYIDL